jgi:hypothetical protein
MEAWWSDLYDPLRIPFYATLGNHDWGQPNSPAAEIVFSQRSPSWRMPAAYYTFTAGDAHFFALDTDVTLAEGCARCQQGALEDRLRPSSDSLGSTV